uniref:Nuclear cap-binding protein subunit 2 n=1 Tax=Lygus hesperus TaxID=30085 RepID=A0A0A9YB58_LYGHE
MVVGTVKRVIMGLNRKTYEPCGFCFVEYYDHESARQAHTYVNNTILDGRTIHVDIDDVGFIVGREFGKSSKTGGQIHDDVREEYDVGRGGFSTTKLAEIYVSTHAPTASDRNSDMHP